MYLLAHLNTEIVVVKNSRSSGGHIKVIGLHYLCEKDA